MLLQGRRLPDVLQCTDYPDLHVKPPASAQGLRSPSAPGGTDATAGGWWRFSPRLVSPAGGTKGEGCTGHTGHRTDRRRDVSFLTFLGLDFLAGKMGTTVTRALWEWGGGNEIAHSKYPRSTRDKSQPPVCTLPFVTLAPPTQAPTAAHPSPLAPDGRELHLRSGQG